MIEKIGKIIRYIFVPPVMVTGLVVALAVGIPGFFHSTAEILVTLGGLAFLPVLAYPISGIVPKLRKKGRDGQRNLAFVLSAIGYLLAWLCGQFIFQNKNLNLIYSTYLLSVVLLLLFNKVFHLRASGHACSVTGPLILATYFLGPVSALVCIPIYAVVFWASLAAKHHTKKELILGTVLCIVACILANLSGLFT